jgi:lipopolysaccharide biosynthesis glycosyltransferase
MLSLLHTDADVMFTNSVDWNAFGDPPQYFTMGVESGREEDSLDGHLYGNAGVMLMNVTKLRDSYFRFVEAIFSEEIVNKGLHFGREVQDLNAV